MPQERFAPYQGTVEKVRDGYVPLPDTGMAYDTLKPTPEAEDVYDTEGWFLYREDPVHTKLHENGVIIQVRDRWLGWLLRERAEGAIHQLQLATTGPDGQVEHTVISDLPRSKHIARYIADTFDLVIISDELVFAPKDLRQ